MNYDLTPDEEYEIHITVDIKTKYLQKFKDAAQRLSLKTTTVELQPNPQNKILTHSTQVMVTAWVVGGDETQRVVSEITNALVREGWRVVRTKIETALSNPHSTLYFEAHVKILTTPERVKDVQNIASLFGAHMSRNPHSIDTASGEWKQYLTLRVPGQTSVETFVTKVRALTDIVEFSHFEILKIEVERVVVDTALDFDKSSWGV